MNHRVTSPPYQQLVFYARQLSLVERVKLVQEILAEPIVVPPYPDQLHAPIQPLETLYGLCAGKEPLPSEEDIQEVRREMWAKFSQ